MMEPDDNLHHPDVDYPVWLISSRESLQRIDDAILDAYLGKYDHTNSDYNKIVGPRTIVGYKDPGTNFFRTTDRNIYVLSDDVMKSIKVIEGSPINSIRPFLLNKETNFPRKDRNETEAIYIFVPKPIDAMYCRRVLEDKMVFMKACFPNPIEYNIVVPKNMFTGEHKGYAIILFKQGNATDIAYCKFIITNSLWGNTKMYIVTSWIHQKAYDKQNSTFIRSGVKWERDLMKKERDLMKKERDLIKKERDLMKKEI